MTLELFLVALIVLGAASAVLRWSWRALVQAPRHNCSGCPIKPGGVSELSIRSRPVRTGLNQKK